MLGANLPDNDLWTLSLLSNAEVLAVDQDASPVSASVASKEDNGIEIWSRPLADGSLAVGLFNRGDIDAQASAKWSDLKIVGPRAVRDLWQRKSLGTFSDQFTAPVPAHGAVFLRLTPAK
jgi:alpha-galactosidase